ncbi:MAG: PadR family transcriptional regulator [Calditrichaeota bacterium]|nr:MAG: PadR family transcriptional regulator [Calditrichota bacterium]MBL1207430.1 PadR family transcriptional regulator [Calditrichota bacterium]NOG47262.1 PadR family transcriptional regulator [Calditrichota bacterium]
MNLEKWQSQIRKGTLEFIILLVLKENEFYGYELIKKIKMSLNMETSEGTIYPILTRLKKAEQLTTRWEHQESGMPRKYYQITEKGLETLEKMKKEWLQFAGSIQSLMGEK